MSEFPQEMSEDDIENQKLETVKAWIRSLLEETETKELLFPLFAEFLKTDKGKKLINEAVKEQNERDVAGYMERF